MAIHVKLGLGINYFLRPIYVYNMTRNEEYLCHPSPLLRLGQIRIL